MILQRLRADFRLALIMLFATITIGGLIPFMVYRFAIGETQIATIMVAAASCIALLSAYAWRSGNVERAGLIAAVTNSTACVCASALGDPAGILWMYPTLLANFLLVRRNSAVAVSVLGVAGLTFVDSALDSNADRVEFVATAFVVSLFAYLFSLRSETQRRQLEVAATRDPLTGAYNRRGMTPQLASAIEASLRDGTPLGLAVLDLDHFKQINDRFGHEAGDEILVRFAELVRSATRRGDRLFRLGGEEFALLLPGVDAAALQRVTEQVRARVEHELRCQQHPVTVSVGATLLLPGESTSRWLSRADTAMYAAKREGRNRVVLQQAAEAVS